MKYLEYLENKKIQWLIVVLIVGFSLFKTIKKNDREELFREHGWSTIGTITGHNMSGKAETYYVKYTYSVDGKTYNKNVNYSGDFIDCYKMGKCIGRKFVVYYNKENPEEAYIDFKDER